MKIMTHHLLSSPSSVLTSANPAHLPSHPLGSSSAASCYRSLLGYWWTTEEMGLSSPTVLFLTPLSVQRVSGKIKRAHQSCEPCQKKIAWECWHFSPGFATSQAGGLTVTTLGRRKQAWVGLLGPFTTRRTLRCWSLSREGQGGWWRVWRTSLMRSGWGSWGCLVWRRGGWGGTSLLSTAPWKEVVVRQVLVSSPK